MEVISTPSATIPTSESVAYNHQAVHHNSVTNAEQMDLSSSQRSTVTEAVIADELRSSPASDKVSGISGHRNTLPFGSVKYKNPQELIPNLDVPSDGASAKCGGGNIITYYPVYQ